MLSKSVLSSQVAIDIGLSLMHFLWQGALVAFLLAVVLRKMRLHSAAARYNVCLVCLLLMAALPVPTYLQVRSHERAERAATVPDGAVPAVADGAVQNERSSLPGASDGAHAGGTGHEASSGARYPMSESLTGAAAMFRNTAGAIAPWMFWLWILGVTALSLRLTQSVLRMNRLKGGGAQQADSGLRKVLARLAHRLGVSRSVVLLCSTAVDVPVAFGWLRPVIIVPVTALRDLVPAQLHALLAHELAHLRRYDYVVNWVQTVIETLLYYHPAVWWVSGRIRHERELCCDDLAVAVCDDPIDMARALASLAALRPEFGAGALSARGGDLLARVRRIVEPRPRAQTGTFGGVAALALSMMVIAGVFVQVTGARAQQEPEAAAGPGVGAVAEQPQSAIESGGRVLAFPDDVSIGSMYIRDLGGAFTPTGQGEGWRVYTEARGTFEAPPDAELMLRVAPRHNERTDISPLGLLGADALTRLDVSDCNLKDDDIEFIGGLTGLKALDLNRNRDLTDRALTHLKGLTSLVWLGLEDAPFSNNDAHLLEALPHLRFFDTNNSNFNDESLEALRGLTGLEYLGLEATKITGAGLTHVRNLSALKTINLENTHITDESLAYLASLPALKELSLQNTPISDSGIEYLAASKSLEVLNVSQTRVTDAALEVLAEFQKLRSVNTNETSVTPERAAELKALLAQNLPSAAIAAPASSQQSSNPVAPKVGVVMSQFTATGPHAMPSPYGFVRQANKAVPILDAANFDVYAIIEPGSQNEGELSSILAENGLSSKIVDGTDVNALRKLDVIFSAWYLNVAGPMLQSMTTAIEAGTGYVNVGPFGGVTPGTTDETVDRILGLVGREYHWNVTGKCPAWGPHPMLGGMRAGDVLVPKMLNGFSCRDTVNVTVLVGPPPGVPETFHPVYLHQLGAGRVVNFQWLDLQLEECPLPQNEIYVRAVNWAAKRSPDVTW